MPQMTLAKEHRGRTAFHSGIAAEESVLRAYRDLGYEILAQRWRGTAGEIDLIVHASDHFIFVEVKKSKTLAAAALRISPRQKARIFATAQEYVASCPKGLLSNMRFDVALVDANGQVEILESALFDE